MSTSTGTTLIALHGFTQNGLQMRVGLAPIAARLPGTIAVECPDGPMEFPDSSVARMRSMLGGEIWPPPYRGWFDASDDGKVYRGFDAALETIASVIKSSPNPESIGVLGFSQGAIFATALAALAAHHELPPLRFAVLVAGRIPRADELQPYLETPIAMPSLHVWGERDQLTTAAAEQLTHKFDAATREVCVWPGPHVVPTHGIGADAIVNFVSRFA